MIELFIIASVALGIAVWTAIRLDRVLDRSTKKVLDMEFRIGEIGRCASGLRNEVRDLNKQTSGIMGAQVAHHKDLDELKKSIDTKLPIIQKAFDKLQFEVKNPPKYKVGDKAPDKGWVVTRVEVVECDAVGKFIAFYPRVERILRGGTGHVPIGISGTDVAITICDYKNQYTATNIKTGEVKTWAE